MTEIDTPLLVVGSGPAALVAAKVASGSGMASVVAAHGVTGGSEPVVLPASAVAVLTAHGIFDVLRPYLASVDPPAISPGDFEHVLKHHCVVDMNVSVFDSLRLVDAVLQGAGVRGVLTDGRLRWPVRAAAFVDAAALPAELPAAITAGADAAGAAIAAMQM